MKFDGIKIIDNSTGYSSEVDIIVLSCNHCNISQNFLKHFEDNFPTTKIRLIWIDNGSTDGTIDYLKTYFDNNKKLNSLLALSPNNLGVIGGRNLGCNISSSSDTPSPYLMYLDNDQYVCPNWLEHHLSVLNNGYDLVSVEAWLMNDILMPIRKNDKLNQLFSYVGCGGMLIKREVIDSIGVFDTIFNPAYFEDPDYNFRAYKKGFKIGWNFKSKIIHMAHQTLGNIENNKKHQLLVNSWKKFKSKWTLNDIPKLKQKDLPEFH